MDAARTVYRWDLDKTYLRTDFDSVRALLKTALEPAADKRTMPGAQTLLRELRGTGPAGIYILSGSPEQMRRVLEAKLRLDDVHWDGFVLKPSLGKLLRGRFRFLRDQVSYKLGALMRSRIALSDMLDEVMFGDDAEADAFVYSVYADLCARRLDAEQLYELLMHANAYEDDARELALLASSLPPRDVCHRIFIHLERVEPAHAFADFGPRVCAFNNYFQAALVLCHDGLLPAAAALRVGAELVVDHAFHPDVLAASFADLTRRRLLGAEAVERLAEEADKLRVPSAPAQAALAALGHALRSEGPTEPTIEPRLSEPLDYTALLTRDRARAQAAKLRHRRR